MMGEFIFRLLLPAALQDRKLTQARVELALEADVAADAVEGARHFGRVDQELVQIGVALEHVAIFGRDLIGLEIGQAGHFVGSPLSNRRTAPRSGPDGAPLPGRLTRRSGLPPSDPSRI